MRKGKGKVFGSSLSIYTIEINYVKTSNSCILDTKCGFHICFDMHGLKEIEEIRHRKLNLVMGNRHFLLDTRIMINELVFHSGVSVDLLYCHYLCVDHGLKGKLMII